MTAMPDPGEPFRREIERIMAPARAAMQETMRRALPRPEALLSESTRRAIASIVVPAPHPVTLSPSQVNLFAELAERVRLSQAATMRSIVESAMPAIHAQAVEQMAQVAATLTASAAIRLATEPSFAATRPAEGAGGATFTEQDVQRIVAAAVQQVTGGQPHGWRWLLCTPQGITTLISILITAASLVVACLSLAKASQPSVNIENSPGSSVTIQSGDDEVVVDDAEDPDRRAGGAGCDAGDPPPRPNNPPPGTPNDQ